MAAAGHFGQLDTGKFLAGPTLEKESSKVNETIGIISSSI